MKILLVCSGNICRSPLAEAVLRSRIEEKGLDQIEVCSAGTLGIEDEPAHPCAVEAAAEAGHDIAAHRSRALTRSAIDESAIVLAMELLHLDEVNRLAPGRKGVHLLGTFAPPGESGLHFDEIRDPLGGGPEDFRECLRVIERCSEGFLSALVSGAVEAMDDAGRPGGTNDGDEKHYFTRITERVQAARGGQPLLTSMEFDIADRWWREGVPLWLVLDAIEAAAAHWRVGEAPRRFLSRCDEEVDRRRRELLP